MMRRKHFLPAVFLMTVFLLTISCCYGGQWYPGIIHAHSIFSDGANSPAKLANIVRTELAKYREDGKCFMIVTDHYDGISGKGPEAFFVYPTAIRNTSIPGQFVASPGLESGSKWHPEPDTVADAHILAIGRLPDGYASKIGSCYDKNPGLGLPLLEKFDFQQQIINRILELGMLPVAAHPSQLLIGGTSILRVDHRFNMHSGYQGLRGVEMYNVLGPDQEEEAFQFYLRLLSEGFSVFVTSGCDYHGTSGSIIPELVLGSLERVTWVYADNLTEEAILKAIAEGKTYAAQNGAQFWSFQPEGPNPGSQVVCVDKPLLAADAYLQAERVELIVYRDGQEVCRQKQNGNDSRMCSYSLSGYKDNFRSGWLDPDSTSTDIRTYVIRVMATKNGIKRTVLVTSPIRLRLRPAGLTSAFFDAIKSGAAARVASFLREDPSLANERDWRMIPEEESMLYHISCPLALSVAAALGKVEIVRLLLDAGANPNGYLYPGEPGPLMDVACTGNIQVTELLIRYGADININSDGNTPLHWAISSKHADLAKWLIEHGADVNARDDGGQRPLTIAKHFGLQDVVKALIAKGAKE